MSPRAGKRDPSQRGPRRGSLARLQNRRPVRTTVLIVGEGRETEPNYFDGLKREDAVGRRFTVTVKRGSGRSPDHVVEEAIQHKEAAERRGEDYAYDEVWCVIDVEGAEKRFSLDKAVRMAERHGIRLCLSNPCFEIWLLAHFRKSGRPFETATAVISELDNLWTAHFRHDYEKNDRDLYDRVSSRTSTAIDNARWVRETHHRNQTNTADSNSSTEVYRLVTQLLR